VLQLYEWFDKIARILPKHHRYTLGTRICNELLDILELLLLASVKGGDSRLLLLRKVDVRLKLLRLLVRLLHAGRSLTDYKYAEFSERTIVIGQMLGGWIEATKGKIRAKP